MVTEADWEHWTIDDLRPYATHVMELFGPHRILFGTDWPVCTLAASYGTVVDVAEQLTRESLSDSERAAIFGDNATDAVTALERTARRMKVRLAYGETGMEIDVPAERTVVDHAAPDRTRCPTSGPRCSARCGGRPSARRFASV